MWGVGPVTRTRLDAIGVATIGQLAELSERTLTRLLGPAAGEKLAALAWNRDPRQLKPHRRARSAGAQSALGRKPASEHVIRPTLLHLADRVATRLRAKSRPGRTVTVRVRFADLKSVTRSMTLDAPVCTTVILARLAERLVRTALADHPGEKFISLLAISVSHLEEHWDLALELPLGLADEALRPGSPADGALGGGPCHRQGPRPLWLGCDRIRFGSAGGRSLGARRLSQAGREGSLALRRITGSSSH